MWVFKMEKVSPLERRSEVGFGGLCTGELGKCISPTSRWGWIYRKGGEVK